MIDLKQLILIATFEEATRQEIQTKLDSLSDDQKRDLENLSWTMIINDYQNKVGLESQIAITEVAQGVRKQEETDLDQIQEKIFDDLSTKLQGLFTQGQIEEVRQKIQEQTAKSS